MTTIKNITILGSGTSTGVPMLGCNCNVCNSPLPQNKRLRSSILITTNEDKNILVDTTPDLRTQLLNNNIKKIDAVILTHTHADHLHGIDDLRPFTFPDIGGPITVYTSHESKNHLHQKFPYIFGDAEKNHIGGGIPKLTIQTVIDTNKESKNETIENLSIDFFLLPHGHMNTLAFRIHNFAYIIDCHEIPTPHLDWLNHLKLDFVIIDCATINPHHKTHLSVDRSIAYLKAIAPKKAGLTHISHDFDHFALERFVHKELGPHTFPLTDGQVFEV